MNKLQNNHIQRQIKTIENSSWSDETRLRAYCFLAGYLDALLEAGVILKGHVYLNKLDELKDLISKKMGV